MRAGTLIAGRYRLLEPLGAGSMGQVWRARDDRLERDVAVKVVDLAAASGPVSRQQMQREVLATARLDHPAIVTTFDGGFADDVAYLVMELLRGESVADRLRRGPLPTSEAVRVASEVARALEATHVIGVVHRDIKPGNVMLVDGGRVKVLDFGIARLASDPTEALGSPVVGTAAFMSPEQAMGASVGPASDVYALGCLLVTMLAGRPPFLGESSVEVAHSQVYQPAPSLRSLRPDAPPSLDALVAQMLAKRPEARPDAAAVVDQLASVAPTPGSDTAATAALPPTGPGQSSGGQPGGPAGPPAPVGTAVLPASGAPQTAVLPGSSPASGAPHTAVLPGSAPAGMPRPAAMVPTASAHQPHTAVLPPSGQPQTSSSPTAASAGKQHTAVMTSTMPPSGASAWAPPKPAYARPVTTIPPSSAVRASIDDQPRGGSQRRPPVKRPGRRGGGVYRRVARLIVLAIVALAALGLVIQGAPRLLALLPSASPSPTTKPTVGRTSTTTTQPAPIPTTSTSLPSVPVPSIPDAGRVARQAAVDSVSSVLDSWAASSDAQESSKSYLVAVWGTSSTAIVDGDNASKELNNFKKELRAERRDGDVPIGVYAALEVALAGVAAVV